MSDSLLIGLVAEGITDFVIIRAALESILNGRSFDLKLLQPEESAAFGGVGQAGEHGGGWKGVYKWCKQAQSRNEGPISLDPLFLMYDLLIVHLDVDVAYENLAGERDTQFSELRDRFPCSRPCPPVRETSNALRAEMQRWLSETELPENVIFCTPASSTESWVIAALLPDDTGFQRHHRKDNWECYLNSESRLGQQPIAIRFKKAYVDYDARANKFQDGWPTVCEMLSEANRFNSEFLAGINWLQTQASRQ